MKQPLLNVKDEKRDDIQSKDGVFNKVCTWQF